MTGGLFVGRFQPFHKGHMQITEQILAKEDEVIIAIGSAQESFTLENPLTAGERIEVIRKLFKERKKIERVIIVPIPDIEENRIWPARVKEYTPAFDRVYSGNSLVLSLFELFEIPTVELKMIERSKYEGRTIRKRILEGRQWQNFVPEATLPILKRVGFSERIKRLSPSHKGGEEDEN